MIVTAETSASTLVLSIFLKKVSNYIRKILNRTKGVLQTRRSPSHTQHLIPEFSTEKTRVGSLFFGIGPVGTTTYV